MPVQIIIYLFYPLSPKLDSWEIEHFTTNTCVDKKFALLQEDNHRNL